MISTDCFSAIRRIAMTNVIVLGVSGKKDGGAGILYLMGIFSRHPFFRSRQLDHASSLRGGTTKQSADIQLNIQKNDFQLW